ncbi:hypothetical protein NE237_028597 [Protea cynaroides]|uniref:Uncharacterized protein n=1 Tax=Protea cynaroides TaxID=273540 RepID=A0A9Q0GQM9_9MAGN|nr:hypothetical protein NE237_028597 [Protea cynaroides]
MGDAVGYIEESQGTVKKLQDEEEELEDEQDNKNSIHLQNSNSTGFTVQDNEHSHVTISSEPTHHNHATASFFLTNPCELPPKADCKLRLQASSSQSLANFLPRATAIFSSKYGFFEENPGWAQYRKNGLPQWKSLEVIFADSYATGAFACSNNDDNIVFGESDGDNLDTEVPQELAPEQPTIGVTNGANVQRNPGELTGLDRTPSAIRKRGRSSDIAGIMNTMLEHSKARLELFTSSMITNTTPTPSPNSVSSAGYSISQCVIVLNQIPDLSKELYVKVMNHMTNNADWRELFMSLDDDKKLWAIESLP